MSTGLDPRFVIYREYRGAGRNDAIFIVDTGYALSEWRKSSCAIPGGPNSRRRQQQQRCMSINPTSVQRLSARVCIVACPRVSHLPVGLTKILPSPFVQSLKVISTHRRWRLFRWRRRRKVRFADGWMI
jgi:hypothetical protein